MPLFRPVHRLRDASVLLTAPWWGCPALVAQLDLNLRFGCFLGVCLATVNVETRTAEPDGLTLAMTREMNQASPRARHHPR